MKKFALVAILVVLVLALCSCDSSYQGTKVDTRKTLEVASNLSTNQPTPDDINYSLERYNLIRRAYWVNGQRERARTLPCEIADVPLGYIALFTDNGAVVGKFVVEGKVSSLNSYLSPDSEYYEGYSSEGGIARNRWIADVDGSYGENDNGIFFFTPDGKYVEWTGTYLYSDIPFEIENPVVKYEVANND